MNRTQENASSIERARPPVPEAPDWFNRARDIANRRPVFRSLPTPPPPPPRMTRRRIEPLIGFLGRPLVLTLSLAALPLFFGIGYWMCGLPEARSRDATHSDPGADTANIIVGNSSLDAGTGSMDLASAREAVDTTPNEHGNLDRYQRSIDTQAGEQWRALPDSTRPNTAIVALPVDRADDKIVLGPSRVTSDDFAVGFSLKTPGQVRQISAEVLKPTSTWFDIAGNDGACATGTCPSPVRNLDRKLNTALNWSATPEAAAAQAHRDGKLVFLIHVSGNFAQPGFT